MKRGVYITIIIVLVLIIIAGGIWIFCKEQKLKNLNSNSNDCNYLSQQLDKYNNNIFAACDISNPGNEKDIFVGGILTNISLSRIINEETGYKEYYLTLQGKNNPFSIYIHSYSSPIYSEGKFYKFNMKNFCWLMTSAASSGTFSDENFTNLEEINCQ